MALAGAGLLGYVSLVGAPAAQATSGISPYINFQGRLLSATGAVISDGTYNVEFRIYQDGTGTADYNGGTFGSPNGLDWTEDYLKGQASGGVVVKNGYFSVNLGSQCSFSGGSCQGGTNAGVNFNDTTLWLSMDVAAGTNATASCATANTSAQFWASCTPDTEMLPMKAMASAVYANNSSELGGLTSGQFVQLAQGIQGASTSTNPAIGINVTSGAGNIVTLQASGADVFDVSSAGNLLFGNGAAHTVSIAQSAASTVGQALSITAGQGGTGTGSNGGQLTLQGGAGGGTTAGGGNVVVDAGAAAGSGTNGSILVGANTDAPVTIGKSTGTQTLTVGQSTVGQTIYIGHAQIATGDTQNINVGDQATGTGKDVIVVGNTNGASSLSLQAGTGGATLNATAGGLTVSTTTSGTLSVTSAGALSLSGAAASTLNVGANTLAVTSSDLNVSTGGVLNVVGGSAGYQIGGAATTANYLRGNGTSFVSSAIQPGDIPACSGTCNYIGNQFSTAQANANFNIQSAGANDVGGVIQGATSQAADLLDLRDSGGGNLDKVDAAGDEEQLGFNDIAGIGGIGQYSNLLNYSEQLNQSGSWVVGGTMTVNGNNTTAPDGNTTASQLVGTGSSTLIQTYTTGTTGTYTFSVWLKQSSGSGTTGLCIFTTGGTPASCTATGSSVSSTDWQRYSVTTAVSGSVTAVKVEILPGNGSTATIWAWGAQLVLGSTPQVYVRTTTAAVTATSGTVSNDLFTANSGESISSAVGTGTTSAITSNALTTGTALSVTSTASAMTTGSLLNINQSGTATGYTGNIVNLQDALTTSTGNLLNLTSTNTTAGNALNVTANALTTGNAVNINSNSTLTTGSLLTVSSSTAGAINTNGIVSLQATGNYTSTSNNGLLNVLANTTTAGTIENIQGGALATGTALNIGANVLTTGAGIVVGDTGTGLTSGSLLKLSSGTTGALTNGLVSLQATGAYTSTSNTGALNVLANATNTGTVVNIQGNALTTGTGLNLTSSGATAMTTGSLLNVAQTGTTTGYTGNVVNIQGSGTTGAGNVVSITSATTTGGSALSITANSATSANAVSITAGGLTGGSALSINAGSAIAIAANGTVVDKVTASNAFQVQNAASSTELNVDTTVNSVAVGTGSTATSRSSSLYVAGNTSDISQSALAVTAANGDVLGQFNNDGTVNLGGNGTSVTNGLTSEGGNLGNGYYVGGGSPNLLSSQKITTTTGGTVVSISTYIGSTQTSPNNKGQMAIYTDNSGNPGTYLGSTAQTTLNTYAWNTWVFTTTVTLSASTSYWLVYWTNDNVNDSNNAQTYNGSVSGAHWYFADGTWSCSSSCTNGMPNTMPAGTRVDNNEQFAIYTTYTDSAVAFQIAGSNGAATFENTSNSVTAFQVQNASGNAVLTADTSTNSSQGQVLLGKASTNRGTLVFDDAAGANTITLQAPATNPSASYVLALPTSETDNDCLQSGTTSGGITPLSFGSCGGGGANTALSNLASVAINTALNFQSTSSASIGFSAAASTTGNGLTVTGQTAGSTANNGGAITIQGGTGTTTGTGGLLTLQGGNAASGGTDGGVTIDAGSGATTANGTLSIGNANSSTITLGNSTVTKTINVGAVGSTAGATTLHVADSTGATQTITIGGNATSGGSASGTTVKLQGGATSETLANSGTTIQTFTNSTTALQLQNSVGTNLVDVDTSGGNINLGVGSGSGGTTLGYTTIGGTVGSGFNGVINAAKFTASTTGTISSMSVYVGANGVQSSPNNLYQLAIYTDSSGSPGAYVASSAVGTLNSTASWNTIGISATLTSGTTYWLAYWTNVSNSSNNAMSYNAVGGSAFYFGSSTWQSGADNGMPATYPGGTLVSGDDLSIYATYSSGGYETTIAGNGTLTQNGAAVFKDPTNSATALQVQNTAGASVLQVGTATIADGIINYIADASFTLGSGACPLTDWSVVGSPTTCAQNTVPSDTYEGGTSLQLVTTTTAGQGITTSSFTSAPATAASGTGEYYTVSFEAMQTGGATLLTGANLKAVATGGGGPSSTCTINGSGSNTLSASGFKQVVCTLTFTATGSITALAIEDTGTISTADTLYIDAVQLQQATTSSGATSAFQNGSLALEGVDTSPLAIQPVSNSTTTLQVQTSSGSTLLSADTLNGDVNVTSSATTAGGTGNGALNVTANSLTTGDGVSIATTSNVQTAGSLLNVSNTATLQTGGGSDTANLLNLNRSLTANVSGSPLTPTLASATELHNYNFNTGTSQTSGSGLTLTVSSSNPDHYLIAEVYTSGEVASGTAVAVPTNVYWDWNGSSGQAMTQIGSAQQVYVNGTLTETLSIWAVAAPTAATAEFGLTGPDNSGDAYTVIGEDWYNVNQSTPYGTFSHNTGTGTTISQAAASASGRVVVDGVGVEAPSGAPTATTSGGASVYTFFDGLADGEGSSSYPATTTSSTMTWNLGSTSTKWGWEAIDLEGAPPGETVSGSVASISNSCSITTGFCNDATNVLSLNQAYTGATGAVLNIGNSGTGSGLTVQNASSVNVFSVNTNGLQVVIGSGSTGESTPTLLVVDNQTGSSTDPSPVNGAMYYNVTDGAFRCGQGGAWVNCIDGIASTLSSVSGTTAAESLGTASHIMVAPLYIPGQITVGDFYVDVTTSFTSGDVGIYNSSGTLLLNGGSGSVTTGTGLKTVAPTQTGSARILSAGQYYVAITGTVAGAVEGGTLAVAGQVRGVENITGGGAVLPSSITLGSSATTMPDISIGTGAF